MATATLLLALGGLYWKIGLLPAVAFVLVGAGRIDAGARAGSIGFRLIILPCAVLLWPLVTWKWMASSRHGRRVSS